MHEQPAWRNCPRSDIAFEAGLSLRIDRVQQLAHGGAVLADLAPIASAAPANCGPPECAHKWQNSRAVPRVVACTKSESASNWRREGAPDTCNTR